VSGTGPLGFLFENNISNYHKFWRLFGVGVGVKCGTFVPKWSDLTLALWLSGVINYNLGLKNPQETHTWLHKPFRLL